jgi:pyrroline-5-carboxylate reductase
MSENLLLVGCGKMGGAMLGGWIDQGVQPDDVTVVEPYAEALKKFADQGVNIVAKAADIPAAFEPDYIIIAVKPQAMDDVIPPYADYANFPGGATFLSIAAGKTIGYFEENLGADAAIIRVMPNTPAAVGRGISVACANGRVSAKAKDDCTKLLSAVGEVGWVDDEALIDGVTAVSGSGPAYVFLLAECMAKAGVEAGLPEDLAMQLARVTISGSGELMRQSADDAATLRQNVTSPGGTTEAALEVLMGNGGLQALMSEAITAAVRRSRALA